MKNLAPADTTYIFGSTIFRWMQEILHHLPCLISSEAHYFRDSNRSKVSSVFCLGLRLCRMPGLTMGLVAFMGILQSAEPLGRFVHVHNFLPGIEPKCEPIPSSYCGPETRIRVAQSFLQNERDQPKEDVGALTEFASRNGKGPEKITRDQKRVPSEHETSICLASACRNCHL